MRPFIFPCRLCPCTKGRNPIPPSGPSPCRILFLGEGPAKVEDETGIPFTGGTGKEFDNYLGLAGLDRPNVAVYNACCCSQPNYRNPTEEEALCCSLRHLPALLSKIQPEIIVPMGAIACSLFPGINLNIHHGIPLNKSFGDWSGIVFPEFHPSAGLHSTQYMIPLRADMKALGVLLKDMDQWYEALEMHGQDWEPYIPLRNDPYPNPDYQVCRTVQDLSAYLPHGQFYELGSDTENRPDGTPYCLTISTHPGSGRLIYATNKKVLQALFSYLNCFRPLLDFHNFLHDKGIYELMGHEIPPYRFHDTMIRAYELGLGGGGDEEESGGRGALGLKVLAYRHLNMEMKSFRDTVLPHTVPLVLEWLIQAEELTHQQEKEVVCECGHVQEHHEKRGKKQLRHSGRCGVGNFFNLELTFTDPPCPCKKWKAVKPPKLDAELSRLNRKIKTLMEGLLEGRALLDGDKRLDPWKRLEGWHDWEKELLSMLGPMPVLDVALLPEDELVDYACRDADAGLRLNQFLNTYKPL